MRSLLAGAVIIFASPAWAGVERDVADILNPLLNATEQQVFDAIGYPTEQTTISGKTIDIWRVTASGLTVSPSYATTTGRVGSDNFSADTDGFTFGRATYDCLIRVMIGSDGQVEGWDMDGARAGCRAFVKGIRARRR